jgi:hypothetical protein
MIHGDFGGLLQKADEEEPGSILLDGVAALEEAVATVR